MHTEDWEPERIVFEAEVFYVDQDGNGYMVIQGNFWILTNNTAYPLRTDKHIH